MHACIHKPFSAIVSSFQFDKNKNCKIKQNRKKKQSYFQRRGRERDRVGTWETKGNKIILGTNLHKPNIHRRLGPQVYLRNSNFSIQSAIISTVLLYESGKRLKKFSSWFLPCLIAKLHSGQLNKAGNQHKNNGRMEENKVCVCLPGWNAGMNDFSMNLNSFFQFQLRLEFPFEMARITRHSYYNVDGGK